MPIIRYTRRKKKAALVNSILAVCSTPKGRQVSRGVTVAGRRTSIPPAAAIPWTASVTLLAPGPLPSKRPLKRTSRGRPGTALFLHNKRAAAYRSDHYLRHREPRSTSSSGTRLAGVSRASLAYRLLIVFFDKL